MLFKRSLAVLLSVVVLFSVVGVAGAQGPDGQDRPSTAESNGRGIANVLLREAANQLDMSVFAMIRGAENGDTVGDVITANGGDVAAVSSAVESNLITRLDTALENGRIDQERYDELASNVSSWIAAGLEANIPRPDGGPMRDRDNTSIRDRVDAETIGIIADSLNLSVEDLMAELQSGKTIGTIIAENNGDIDAIATELITNITTRIEDAVANGELDGERATELLNNLEERVLELLSRTERPQRGDNMPSTDANTDTETGEGVLE